MQACIVSLGLTMFTRWIPVHQAFAAETGPGSRPEFDFPGERSFPLPVVVGHGLAASITVTLVLLTVLGVGGS
jgi:manganese efflux pump family protein